MLASIYVFFNTRLEVVDVFLAEPLKELHSFHVNVDPFLVGSETVEDFKGEYHRSVYFRHATPAAYLTLILTSQV